MKKVIFGAIAIIFTITAFAQNPVNDVFNTYEGKEGFTTVNISGELFKMLMDLKDDSTHGKKLTTEIKEIKILAQEDGVKSGVNFHELIYNKLDKNDFKELLTVKDENDNVNILAKETNGHITEFLLIASGDDNVLINIKGNIVLNELGNLAESINLKGFEMLKMLETGNIQ